MSYGHEIRRRKRLHLPQQILVDSLRARHGLVVEHVIHDAGGGLPPHVAHLPRLLAALAVAIALGRVVVEPRLGPPRAVHARIEGPVGDVEAIHRVHERAALQRARRKPLARIPAADVLADLALGDLEREQALGTDRCLDLLVVHQGRRPAELAVLADARRLEDAHRLAAAALHGAGAGAPFP